jgi:hypothetical protein
MHRDRIGNRSRCGAAYMFLMIRRQHKSVSDVTNKSESQYANRWPKSPCQSAAPPRPVEFCHAEIPSAMQIQMTRRAGQYGHAGRSPGRSGAHPRRPNPGYLDQFVEARTCLLRPATRSKTLCGKQGGASQGRCAFPWINLSSSSQRPWLRAMDPKGCARQGGAPPIYGW